MEDEFISQSLLRVRRVRNYRIDSRYIDVLISPVHLSCQILPGCRNSMNMLSPCVLKAGVTVSQWKFQSVWLFPHFINNPTGKIRDWNFFSYIFFFFGFLGFAIFASQKVQRGKQAGFEWKKSIFIHFDFLTTPEKYVPDSSMSLSNCWEGKCNCWFCIAITGNKNTRCFSSLF
jgi:hypothetical protein